MPMRFANAYYAIEYSANEHARVYHSKLCLLATGSQQGAYANVAPEELDFELSPILKIALAITGVEVAQIYAYKLVIQKSPMFDWDSEIEPAIINLLEGVATAIQSVVPIETAMRLPAQQRTLVKQLTPLALQEKALRAQRTRK